MLALAPTFDGKRTIPPPRMTELMLEALKLTPADKVLEIGTGSGTQTREFAKTGAEIHSIELEPWVDPTVVIGECVFLHTGDGKLGIPAEAPFTAIVATCGVPEKEIPKEWQEQLADGGRLVVPVGDVYSQRVLLLIKRGYDLVPEQTICTTRFQMLRDALDKKAS